MNYLILQGVLFDRIKPRLMDSAYFTAKGSIPSFKSPGNLSVSSLQNGIVRVSCLDSLDRTNLMLSIFAKFMYALQCQSVALVKPDGVPFISGVDYEISRDPAAIFRVNIKGELGLQILWADSGDTISVCYAGTPALKVF